MYAEGFDPILPADELRGGPSGDPLVERHRAEIVRADGIVVVHPNWWGQPPAILKGWVDRVLSPGAAYAFAAGDAGGVPVGLLRATVGLIFNTTDTPHERELVAFGDPLERLWRDNILRYCGVPGFERRVFGVLATSTPAQRLAWLEDARALASRCLG